MACGEPARSGAGGVGVATRLAWTATLLQLAIVVPSALNVTLPSLLGLPEPVPVPVTVAVKVIESPKVEGFRLEVTAVDVARLLTVWLPVRVPVLSAKLLPPAYSAVMACGEPA